MPSRSTEGIRRRVPFLLLDISMGLNSEEPTEPTLGMIESQLVEESVTATSGSGVNAKSSEVVITRPEVVTTTASPDNVCTSQYPQRNHCPPEFY